MSHISTYKMPFKRRLGQKTNYKKRLALIQSGVPRAVVRKSNKNITVQIIEYYKPGDKTIVSGISGQLKEFGWTQFSRNTSAAYLTGYMVGLKAKNKGVKKAVLDIGLNTPVHKSRLFAGMKGLIDAGIEIPHDPLVFPSEDRIKGVHLKKNAKELFDSVKSAIERKFGEKK